MNWEIVFTAISTFVVSEFSKEGIKDTYKILKEKILVKFGRETEIVKAIDNLEENSDSIKRRQKLGEELKKEELEIDNEITGIAKTLLNQIEPNEDRQAALVLESGRDIKNVIVNSPGAKITYDYSKK